MATSREERMASRLRGAGRHQVEDLSFGFVLPTGSPQPSPEQPAAPFPSRPPPPAPAPRSANPNTSAKRRRIVANEPPPPAEPVPPTARTPIAPLAPPQRPAPTATRSGTSAAPRPNPYDLPDNSTEDTRSRTSARTTRSRPARTPGPALGEDDDDELESLPRATPVTQAKPRENLVATATRREVIDIVAESPTNAPGSGQRRRVVRVSEVATSSSAVLQRVMQQQRKGREVEGEDEITAEVDVSGLEAGPGVGSSPLVRKVAARDKENRKPTAQMGGKNAEIGPSRRTVRRSGAGGAGFGLGQVDELSPAPAPSAGGKRSVRLSGGTAADEVDELSPALARTTKRNAGPLAGTADEVDELSPTLAKTTKRAARPLAGSMDEVDELSPTATRTTRRSGRSAAGGTANDDDKQSPAPARAARRSVRVSAGSGAAEEADELSPDKGLTVMGPPAAKRKPQKAATKTTKETGMQPEKEPPKPPPKAQRKDKPQPQPKPTRAPEVVEPAEPEEAEEIDETEAARRLGRKRPRRSIDAPAEAEQSELRAEVEEPAAKRRKRKPPQSPAAQQPPKTRKEKKQPASQPKKSAPKKKTKPTPAADDDQDELEAEAKGTIPIQVQRFTKPRKVHYDGDSDTGPDILASDTIPFASRAGVNAVDVLAQMCDEMVASFLSNLHDQGRAAADAAARREFRTMIRALEAFREELRTRLLEHTIALDTLQALQKRVRAAQRDKIALREEILRIRGERELVALRMDAVRVRHEGESREALRDIHLSSAMHDIDLAIEKGVAAEPLSAAEQSKAELANLEFLISKVTEQASSKSGQGGTLRQIKEFNAFLERAAAALEGR